jgi:hypothetical protein
MSKKKTEMEVVSNEETQAKKVWKKSELLERQKELEALNEKLIKEMQEREYEIDFKNKKVFDRLVKFLEKDAPWGHTTATGLIMLFHNMREQKELVKDKEWNGIAKLRAANVSILWSMVTKMTGSGFYEAKSFVELMAACGESLSNAVQKVHNDNQAIRDTHAQLAQIDQDIDSPDTINDVEDSTKTTSLAEEVDPVTENV